MVKEGAVVIDVGIHSMTVTGHFKEPLSHIIESYRIEAIVYLSNKIESYRIVFCIFVAWGTRYTHSIFQ